LVYGTGKRFKRKSEFDVLAHAENAQVGQVMFKAKSEDDRERISYLVAVGKVHCLLGSPRHKSDFLDLSMRGRLYIRNIAAASLFWAALSHGAFATGTEPAENVQTDAMACTAAAAAGDDDKTVSACGALIDNEKTPRADRIKALIARGAAFSRKDMTGQAIADYDVALRLDPGLADIFNARGELWRRRGNRPKALADFAMAIKLNPGHPTARANYKSLALEIERLGALIAVAGKPSFYCRTARRAVEKAICADPELADLDREIHAMHVRVIGDARNVADAQALQREQNAFIASRNAGFGRPGYDLRKAMKKRLQDIVGVDGY
jgi:tetratricopeptide (TPR) repeat protein